MAKLFSLAKLTAPPIYPDVTSLIVGVDYFGHVLMDTAGNYGAYLFSGSATQLSAVNALTNVVGIVAVTDNGNVHWAELDNTISAGVRANLNTWLTNHGFQTIPAGWTYRQVVNAIFRHFNNSFDIDTNGVDVTDGT